MRATQTPLLGIVPGEEVFYYQTGGEPGASAMDIYDEQNPPSFAPPLLTLAGAIALVGFAWLILGRK